MKSPREEQLLKHPAKPVTATFFSNSFSGMDAKEVHSSKQYKNSFTDVQESNNPSGMDAKEVHPLKQSSKSIAVALLMKRFDGMDAKEVHPEKHP